MYFRLTGGEWPISGKRILSIRVLVSCTTLAPAKGLNACVESAGLDRESKSSIEAKDDDRGRVASPTCRGDLVPSEARCRSRSTASSEVRDASRTASGASSGWDIARFTKPNSPLSFRSEVNAWGFLITLLLAGSLGFAA